MEIFGFSSNVTVVRYSLHHSLAQVTFFPMFVTTI